MNKSLSIIFSFLLLLSTFSAPVAADDSYPTKPVRLIVNFAAGGGLDILARAAFPKVAERLGKQVVVENHAGAGGILGAEMVAKSAPDGYTLLCTSSAIAINPSLFKVPYDPNPLNAFAPVALLGSAASTLVVHPSVPANSVKELIALAKKQPGNLVGASNGSGSYVHLTHELFKMMADIDYKIVQFKGGGPAMIDTMGGHSQIFFSGLSQTFPPIQAGKLTVLGFTGSVRSKLLPDVPTIAEAGVPGYTAKNWYGVLAPIGTPRAIVERLYKEIALAMSTEDMKTILRNLDIDADLMAPADFGKFIETETGKWEKVIKKANLKVE